MENEKFKKSIKRLSVFAIIAGVLTILGFILMLGVAISGGEVSLDIKIFSLFIIGLIALSFFGSARRLRRNTDHHQKLRLPTIFLLVTSIIAVLPLVIGIFGFHPRIVLGVGPMSNLGYLVAIVMIIDSIRILRTLSKLQGVKTNS